jgi:hypothetical protein
MTGPDGLQTSFRFVLLHCVVQTALPTFRWVTVVPSGGSGVNVSSSGFSVPVIVHFSADIH